MSDSTDRFGHTMFGFSCGETVRILELIPCDETEAFQPAAPEGFDRPTPVTMARCGRVVIIDDGDRELRMHSHESPSDARKCYVGKTEEARAMVVASEVAAQAFTAMPHGTPRERLEATLQGVASIDGFPPELLAMITERADMVLSAIDPRPDDPRAGFYM